MVAFMPEQKRSSPDPFQMMNEAGVVVDSKGVIEKADKEKLRGRSKPSVRQGQTANQGQPQPLGEQMAPKRSV